MASLASNFCAAFGFEDPVVIYFSIEMMFQKSVNQEAMCNDLPGLPILHAL